MKLLWSVFWAATSSLAAYRAEAATITTYCESAVCEVGDIDIGPDLYALSGATFGSGAGLIFRGLNRDETTTQDIDRWYFEATVPYTAFVDYFSGSGAATILVGGLTATLSSPITSSMFIGSFAAGSHGYIVVPQVVGSYSYELRVQATDIPLPPSVLLLITPIFGLWLTRWRTCLGRLTGRMDVPKGCPGV